MSILPFNLIVADDFDRAGILNGTSPSHNPTSTWTGATGFTCDNGEVYYNGTGTAAVAGQIPTAAGDKDIDVLIADFGTGGTMGLDYRHVTSGNTVRVSLLGGITGVVSLQNGGTTVLNTPEGAVSDGDILTLRIVGRRLYSLVNGEEVLAPYDSSLAVEEFTRPALRYNGSTAAANRGRFGPLTIRHAFPTLRPEGKLIRGAYKGDVPITSFRGG